MRKTTLMQLIELREGGPIRALLGERLGRGQSLAQVAGDWGVTRACVSAWARDLGFRHQTSWTEADEPIEARVP